TLCFQFGMNARSAVYTPIVMISIFNTLRELFILQLSLAFSSFTPVVVSILRDFKYLTHAYDRKEMTILLNELIFHEWGCVKMLMAFFNISLSCRRISFSLLNR